MRGARLYGYILGVFGISLTNLLGGVFIFQYYVYTVNLSSILVSIGLSIRLIIAAFCSIFWGIVIDNKKPGKYGKRRPYLFYGLPIWVITSILQWYPPWFCPKDNSMFLPTAVYFSVIISIKAIAGTSVLIAHASMYPEQCQTDKNRKKVASLGTVLNIIASVLALLLPLFIQSLLADPENVKWWEPSGKVIILYIPLIGIIFAIVGLVSMIFTFFSVDESFHQDSTYIEKEKLTVNKLIHQMNIPANDKKFRKYMAFVFFTGISGRIVGLVIIPFLIYVLKFRGTDYFIYVIVSFSCKFGWYFFWKKILKKQALLSTYSMCTAVAVISSFLELFFLIEILNFEVKIALFIISYGTVLGCMYAFGIFGGPLFSELVYEAALNTENYEIDEAVTAISGAYVGLSTFIGSLAPAAASILIGIILTGPNQENALILTLCLCSTGIFYLIALIYLSQIKLEKRIAEIKPIFTEPKSDVFVE